MNQYRIIQTKIYWIGKYIFLNPHLTLNFMRQMDHKKTKIGPQSHKGLKQIQFRGSTGRLKALAKQFWGPTVRSVLVARLGRCGLGQWQPLAWLGRCGLRWWQPSAWLGRCGPSQWQPAAWLGSWRTCRPWAWLVPKAWSPLPETWLDETISFGPPSRRGLVRLGWVPSWQKRRLVRLTWALNKRQAVYCGWIKKHTKHAKQRAEGN